MEEKLLTLKELNLMIRDSLDKCFPGMVWVKAEISELSINRNGHCYLELADTDPHTGEVLARARATIWSYTFRMLKPYFETTTGQPFGKGINVLVSVRVEFHSVYGLSLNIRDIDPAYTLGDLALKRREIVRRLQQDGVFDMNRELELPLVPQRIAVISSPTAAGLQDFLHQLSHHAGGFHFETRLFPATMQGTETADSVIRALDRIYEHEAQFDVVVLIRGGGAQLDLAAFDHYELAYHVAQFPLPVITGIGHDKDETIVDLVAHTRLKTPTAVAEFLINGAELFDKHLLELRQYGARLLAEQFQSEKERMQGFGRALREGVRQLVREQDHRFQLKALQLKKTVPACLKQQENGFLYYRHRLQVKMQSVMGSGYYLLDRLENRLQRESRMLLEAEGVRLERQVRGVREQVNRQLEKQESRLALAEEMVWLVDPQQVLKRGYSLTYHRGRLLRSESGLAPGDRLVTRLYDGEVNSEIINPIQSDEHKENEL
ncbi:MAG: exodeoxyribonuclease VII large subunit [Mangrovibacterium sp.]